VAERGSVWHLSVQRELVDGLLGADLIGYSYSSHCNNFLETWIAALEGSRNGTDRRNRQGHLTRVRPYPISVAFRNIRVSLTNRSGAGAERALCAPS